REPPAAPLGEPAETRPRTAAGSFVEGAPRGRRPGSIGNATRHLYPQRRRGAGPAPHDPGKADQAPGRGITRPLLFDGRNAVVGLAGSGPRPEAPARRPQPPFGERGKPAAFELAAAKRLPRPLVRSLRFPRPRGRRAAAGRVSRSGPVRGDGLHPLTQPVDLYHHGTSVELSSLLQNSLARQFIRMYGTAQGALLRAGSLKAPRPHRRRRGPEA